MGILGFAMHCAFLRITEEMQWQESLLIRERVLEGLRSLEKDLRGMAAQSLHIDKDIEEGLPACKKEQFLPQVVLAFLADSRGTLLWSEGLPPHEAITLPPREILEKASASSGRFLFGSTSTETFLLGASWEDTSSDERDLFGETLFLGTKLSSLTLEERTSGFFTAVSTSLDALGFCCLLPGRSGETPEIPLSISAIVHEIDESESPLIFLPSERGPRAYFALRNWNGKVAALLSFYPPGNANSLIFRSFSDIFMLALILGTAFFGILFFVLHRSVILPLHKLSAFLGELIQENRFAPSSQRIPPGKNDEISLVGSSINSLLDTMEEVRKEERYNQQRLLALAENIPGAVYRSKVDRQFSKVFVSDNFEQLTGYNPKDILNNSRINITDITHPEDRIFLLTAFWKQLEERGTFSINYRILRRDGEYIWIHDCGKVTQDEATGERFIDGVLLDMTDLKRTEMRLQEEKNRYKDLTDSLPQTIFETDIQGNIRFMNRNGFSSFLYHPKDFKNRDFSWLELFEEEDRGKARQCLKRLLEEDREIATELTARTSEGKNFPAALYINPVRQTGEIYGVLGIIIDLSAQKVMEEKLRFLSMHDSLTGLYNRAFFEEEMQRMETRRFDPLGAIMCDLDGLKLVNDIMGHATGDRLLIAAACILRQTFRSSDVIARVGGDEFAVLLPQCPQEQILHILERLHENIEIYNATTGPVPISISVGYACREKDSALSLSLSVEALVNDADAKMYRHKLRQSAAVRRRFVDELRKNFYNSSVLPGAQEHQGHARDLMLALWKHLGKPENEEPHVELFALFHDIGYIGIPPEILGKPGPLDEEEWQTIRRHPEIGHRIALSSPDLAPVAELILKHQERPDGKGYPLGLQREEIPEICLLFALADAYTSMISHRPFREARTPEEALEEIRRCEGAQFDSHYTKIFLEFLRHHPELHYPSGETPGENGKKS
ncbi:MAG TPA: diguanylate cyclase, partial [Synergistaceae bacterium]|nr:diguanylate cyclase [Synergistaceae bacterium]